MTNRELVELYCLLAAHSGDAAERSNAQDHLIALGDAAYDRDATRHAIKNIINKMVDAPDDQGS